MDGRCGLFDTQHLTVQQAQNRDWADMDQAGQHSRDPFNTRRPVVYTLKGWRKLLFYPFAWLLWIYFRTWRFRVGEADRQQLDEYPNPRVFVLWHNRSLLGTEIIRRLLNRSRVVSLISPSRMAAWEVALFEFMRIGVIRGSTTRRSVQSGIEIMRHLQHGYDIGISPDGPSGPLYSFQSGALAFADRAKVPIVLIIPNCSLALRLNTWDRHMIPLPFARIDVRVRAIPADDPIRSLPTGQALEEIRRVCLEMTSDPF